MVLYGVWSAEVICHHKKVFVHFSILNTMYRWSMMKNIQSPLEYVISPTEISVNSYDPGPGTQANLH